MNKQNQQAKKKAGNIVQNEGHSKLEVPLYQGYTDSEVCRF